MLYHDVDKSTEWSLGLNEKAVPVRLFLRVYIRFFNGDGRTTKNCIKI